MVASLAVVAVVGYWAKKRVLGKRERFRANSRRGFQSSSNRLTDSQNNLMLGMNNSVERLYSQGYKMVPIPSQHQGFRGNNFAVNYGDTMSSLESPSNNTMTVSGGNSKFNQKSRFTI